MTWTFSQWRKKPKVWSSRTARGWAWFVTYPGGDTAVCRSWREAMDKVDRFAALYAREFRLR